LPSEQDEADEEAVAYFQDAEEEEDDIVGLGAADSGFNAVKEGWLKYYLTHVLYNPITMGAKSIARRPLKV
jgi:hypothetical protein